MDTGTYTPDATILNPFTPWGVDEEGVPLFFYYLSRSMLANDRSKQFGPSKDSPTRKITRRTIWAKGFNLLQERVDKKD